MELYKKEEGKWVKMEWYKNEKDGEKRGIKKEEVNVSLNFTYYSLNFIG